MSEESRQVDNRLLSGSVLKLVAVITMLIDHTASFLNSYVPFLRTELFTLSLPMLSSRTITPYFLMRCIGRTAFPLFCFLLVEGWKHTSNRFRYGLSLLIAALISEFPFDVVHGQVPYNRQNVFFTLFLGYIALCIYERYRDRFALRGLLLIALFVFTYFFAADYRISGVAFILLIYVAQKDLIVIAFIGCIILQMASFPAYILMAMYNGRRGFVKGPVLKYAFYLFYPVHLMVLWLIQLALR
ncbi:MAG: TraX protein [Lachnospiraceae bacterium]|nr:TraX protein [Lachnospiraceae bacterium]